LKVISGTVNSFIVSQTYSIYNAESLLQWSERPMSYVSSYFYCPMRPEGLYMMPSATS